MAIAEHLDLDDLEIVQQPGPVHPAEQAAGSKGAGSASAGTVFAHPCRCSGSYVLHEEDLSEAADSVIVGCSSCSLHIRVSYSVS